MNIKVFSIILVVIIASLSRLIPHPPNFTPIIALAIFSGAHLKDKKLAFTIPIFAILLSDIFLRNISFDLTNKLILPIIECN